MNRDSPALTFRSLASDKAAPWMAGAIMGGTVLSFMLLIGIVGYGIHRWQIIRQRKLKRKKNDNNSKIDTDVTGMYDDIIGNNRSNRTRHWNPGRNQEIGMATPHASEIMIMPPIMLSSRRFPRSLQHIWRLGRIRSSPNVDNSQDDSVMNMDEIVSTWLTTLPTNHHDEEMELKQELTIMPSSTQSNRSNVDICETSLRPQPNVVLDEVSSLYETCTKFSIHVSETEQSQQDEIDLDILSLGEAYLNESEIMQTDESGSDNISFKRASTMDSVQDMNMNRFFRNPYQTRRTDTNPDKATGNPWW